MSDPNDYFYILDSVVFLYAYTVELPSTWYKTCVKLKGPTTPQIF